MLFKCPGTFFAECSYIAVTIFQAELVGDAFPMDNKKAERGRKMGRKEKGVAKRKKKGASKRKILRGKEVRGKGSILIRKPLEP